MTSPLRNRDFRYLWLALSSSLLAAGVWVIALPLFTLHLGYGPATVGIVVGCGLIGTLASLLFGGALLDRHPKRTILAWSAFIPGTVLLAICLWAEAATIPWYALAATAAIVGACDGVYGPANESLLPEIVEKEHLHVGNSLQALVESLLLKAFGPAIGGATIALAGPAPALAVVGVLFLVTAAFSRQIVPAYEPPAPDRSAGWASVFQDIGDGFRYVAQTKWIWTAVLWSALALLLQAGPRSVALPVVFGEGSAGAYALIMVGYGIASAVGSLVSSFAIRPDNRFGTLFAAWSLGSLPLIAIAFHPTVAVAAVAMVLVGLFNAYGNVLWQTLMQQGVPDDLRGRVTSVDWFGSISLMPISTVVTGLFIDHGIVRLLFLLAGTVPVVLAFIAYAIIAKDSSANSDRTSTDPAENPPLDRTSG
jgi:MFS family permease